MLGSLVSRGHLIVVGLVVVSGSDHRSDDQGEMEDDQAPVPGASPDHGQADVAHQQPPKTVYGIDVDGG